MSNEISTIVIDVFDDKIRAYDDDSEEICNYYSGIEISSLLEEIPKLEFDAMQVDEKNNSLTCTYGDEVLVFRNLSRLRWFDEFDSVNRHLEKERDKLIINKQKEKLKNRKSKKVSRLSIFALATMLALPCEIDADAINQYVTYSDVSYSEIKDSEYSIDGLDSMVLQGICSIGDNTFITAYDSSWKKDNSIVYILDKNNECIKEVELYNNSHVGGICYDDDNEIFWITDKGGTISGYTYDAIYYDNSEVASPKFKKVDVGSNDLINHKGLASAAYITYHDGQIFVGNFFVSGNGILKSFDIKDDGNIDLDSCKTAKFLDKVQGISFYEKDGQDYLLVSSSYGQVSSSELKIFKYDKDSCDYTVVPFIQMDMPPMMEQITFNKNGKLVTLFESNAAKFKKINNASSDVVVTNIGEVVDNTNFKVL